MTGANIDGWNISFDTRLDDIDCRYCYILDNGVKKQMPSEGDEFKPGEFSRYVANKIRSQN